MSHGEVWAVIATKNYSPPRTHTPEKTSPVTTLRSRVMNCKILTFPGFVLGARPGFNRATVPSMLLLPLKALRIRTSSKLVRRGNSWPVRLMRYFQSGKRSNNSFMQIRSASRTDQFPHLTSTEFFATMTFGKQLASRRMPRWRSLGDFESMWKQ